MSSTKRIGGEWLLLILGLIILQILFDPLSTLLNLSENFQARVGLPAAREKWEAQGITNYSFRLNVLLPQELPNKMRVEVRNGAVVQIYPILLESNVLEGKPLPPTAWTSSTTHVFFSNYTNFTIPRLLIEVEQSLSQVSQISIDPKYGFISSVRFGKPNDWGLLTPKVSHCCSSFEIQNFQILEK